MRNNQIHLSPLENKSKKLKKLNKLMHGGQLTKSLNLMAIYPRFYILFRLELIYLFSIWFLMIKKTAAIKLVKLLRKMNSKSMKINWILNWQRNHSFPGGLDILFAGFYSGADMGPQALINASKLKKIVLYEFVSNLQKMFIWLTFTRNHPIIKIFHMLCLLYMF